MQRIAIAVLLSGLLAACGQESQPVAEGGASAQLDYIDAVPIDEDAPAPVAEPERAARKDEPATERETDSEEAETPAAPSPPPSPEPAGKADDAAEATRRANETTPVPYVATAPETPSPPN